MNSKEIVEKLLVDSPELEEGFLTRLSPEQFALVCLRLGEAEGLTSERFNKIMDSCYGSPFMDKIFGLYKDPNSNYCKLSKEYDKVYAIAINENAATGKAIEANLMDKWFNEQDAKYFKE